MTRLFATYLYAYSGLAWRRWDGLIEDLLSLAQVSEDAVED
jgi:hypothetical protein